MLSLSAAGLRSTPSRIRGELSVSGRTDLEASPNEDLWRSVRVHGTEALQAYLGQLYVALPSFAMVARHRRQDGGCAGVEAEFSGVNNGGVPFDAGGRNPGNDCTRRL